MIRRSFIIGAIAMVVMVAWMIKDARGAGFACMPKSQISPTAPGTTAIEVGTSAGKARGFWCPGSLLADGRQGWRRFEFIVLDKYANAFADPLTVMSTVANAPDPLAAVNAALTSGTLVPATGSQDEYEYRLLKFNLCQAMTTPPFPAPITSVQEDCGIAPTAPGAKPDIWRALGTAIYTIANGKLVAPIPGAKATVGALCDGAAPLPLGTVTYMPLVGGPTTQVTSCKKASQ